MSDKARTTSDITKKISKFIATFAYSGMVKKGPGTMGSFATIVAFLIIALFDLHRLLNFALATEIMLVLSFVIYGVGYKATAIYMETTGKHDPKEVVIDEVVGQLITIALAAPVLKNLTMISDSLIVIFLGVCFFWFRIFDIIKPWPISWIDQKMDNAHGVMLDDVLAGIFAGIVTYLIFAFMV